MDTVPPPAANGTHPAAPAAAETTSSQVELEVARQQIMRLQTELDLTRAELGERPSGQPAASLSAFDDTEGGECSETQAGLDE